MISTIVQAVAQSSTIQALGIAAMILFFGFRLLTGLTTESPFSPFAIQILALIVILPVVLTLALEAKFPTEGVTGLLGTIVGFFFGGAGHQKQERTDTRSRQRQAAAAPTAEAGNAGAAGPRDNNEGN